VTIVQENCKSILKSGICWVSGKFSGNGIKKNIFVKSRLLYFVKFAAISVISLFLASLWAFSYNLCRFERQVS